MPTAPHAPFVRAAYLRTVAAKHRALAERLCDALERAFGAGTIALYSGFPVVMRDGAWFGGFAVRATGTTAYCCDHAAIAKHAAELKPFLSGKSCIKVKAVGAGKSRALPEGATLDEVVLLVERVWRTAAKGEGSMSKADRAKRDRITRERSAHARASDAKGLAKRARTSARTSARTAKAGRRAR